MKGHDLLIYERHGSVIGRWGINFRYPNNEKSTKVQMILLVDSKWKVITYISMNNTVMSYSINIRKTCNVFLFNLPCTTMTKCMLEAIISGHILHSL